MKKFISIVLLLAMLLCLCACGKAEEQPVAASPEPEQTAEPVETAPAGPEPAVVATELYFAGSYDEAYEILADIESGPAAELKALCLYYGYGTDIDAEAAVEIFEALAAEGSAVANHLLGKASLEGKGTALNPQKAEEYFKAAIAAAEKLAADEPLYASACYALADCKANAYGCDKDLDAALSAARRAADTGSLSVLERLELARIFTDRASGRMTAVNAGLDEHGFADRAAMEQRLEYLKSAPALGEQDRLDIAAYEEILGKLGPADEELALADKLCAQAVEGLEALVAEDNIPAIKLMGDLYFGALGSGEADYAKALEYYMLAADYDYAPAQAQIALMYQDGLGVEQSYELAMEWNNRAAQQGNSQGQAQIGYLYHMGLGVTQNLDEAGRWYLRAAEMGNAWAAEKFQETELTNPHLAFEFHA